MIALVNRTRISIELPPVLETLPKRKGAPPQIHVRYPCLQKEETSPSHIREILIDKASRLEDVTIKPTDLSVPALALNMDEASKEGIEEAFIRNREFVLIRDDGSVHLPLMLEWGEYVLKNGWGCIHPLVRYMAGALPPQNFIIYAPRDEEELEIVWRIVQASYFYARGWIEYVDV